MDAVTPLQPSREGAREGISPPRSPARQRTARCFSGLPINRPLSETSSLALSDLRSAEASRSIRTLVQLRRTLEQPRRTLEQPRRTLEQSRRTL